MYTTEGMAIDIYIYENADIDYKKYLYNQIKIIWVLSGSVYLELDEEMKLLEEDDLFIVNNDSVYRIINNSENNIIFSITINLNKYIEYYPKLENIRFRNNFTEEDKTYLDYMKKHMGMVAMYLYKHEKGYQLFIGSEIILTITDLIKQFSIEEPEQLEDHPNLNQLKSILKYMNENIESITLTDLSNNFYLNIYYLSHFIKDNLGISFRDYIQYIRLNKFLNLLLSTDLMINEISDLCGFSSIQYLNKIFKEKYGLTPTEYKDMYFSKDENTEHVKIIGKKDLRGELIIRKIQEYL